jgi:hypothetical protein
MTKTTRVDFDAINKMAMPVLLLVLQRIYPAGVVQGCEYCVGDLTGTPGSSLKINLRTGKWADFATEDRGGDPISLVAAKEGVTQVEAALLLARLLGRAG